MMIIYDEILYYETVFIHDNVRVLYIRFATITNGYTAATRWAQMLPKAYIQHKKPTFVAECDLPNWLFTFNYSCKFCDKYDIIYYYNYMRGYIYYITKKSCNNYL